MTFREKLSPYPGLRPFREDENFLFFGREEQTAELVRLLREHRFLAVVGRSGSGKSSLVRAGLLPELQGGMMQHAGSAWEIAVLRPGGHPIRNLASSLIGADLYDQEDGEALPRLLATLNHSALGLVEAFRQAGLEGGANLLIVVDQFEELFRFERHDTQARDEAHAFVELLLEASRTSEVPIYIILTMRSDYLGDCSHVPGLAEAVNRGEYLIPRLGRNQLRAAMEGPAKVGGGEIAYRLVQHLLNELGDEEDQLPVLQHALMRTWSFWQGDYTEGEAVDLRHYEASGGMGMAISNHADEVFDGLPDNRHRAVAERLFRSLTVKGDDNRGVRRPTRLKVLGEIAGEENAIVKSVIDAYRQPGVTFLMPGEELALEDDTVIDLSHESLMRVWQRLRRWVDDEAQSARIYRRLVDTAHLRGEDKAGLYHNPDLEIALAWRDEEAPNRAWSDQYGGGFERAMTFLDESEAEAHRIQREAEEARLRELDQAKALAESQARTATLLKRFASVVVAAFVVALGLAVWATKESHRASEAEDVARAAAREAENAASAAENAQGRTWLANARLLKDGKDDFSARLKAVRAFGFEGFGREHLTEAQKKQFPVLLKEGQPGWDGARELSVADGKATLLWQNGSLPQHPSSINSAVLSPDGRLAASTSEGEHLVRIWDGVSGDAVTTLDASLVQNPEVLAFSPDGGFLTLAGDAELAFWRVENQRFTPVPNTPFTLSRQAQAIGEGGDGGQTNASAPDIRSLAFSPDGATLAMGDDKGRVYVWRNWRSFDNMPVAPVQEHLHDGRIEDLEFQPGSGGLLASVGGKDATIQLLDGKSFERVAELPAEETFVREEQVAKLWSLSFNSDGRFLVAGGDHLPITIWNVASREVETTLLRDEWEAVQADVINGRAPNALGFQCRGLDFSADGRRLAVRWAQSGGTWDPRWYKSTVSIFDCSNGMSGMSRLHDIPMPANPPENLQANVTSRTTLAPRGDRLLATAGAADRLQLWDLQRNKPVGGGTGAHSGRIRVIHFSHDGTRFASGDEYGFIRIWEAHTGRLKHVIDAHLSRITQLCFSPDGRKLFSVANKDKALAVWDVETGENLPPIPQDWPTMGLVLSPDEQSIAVSGWNNTIRFYDIRTLEERSNVRVAHGNQLKFSPDGKQMVVFRHTGNPTDSQLVLYEIDENHSPVRPVANPESLHNTRVDGIEYSPDGLSMVLAHDDGVVQTWNRQPDGSWSEALTLEMPGGATNASAVFGSSGELLFTGDSSGTLAIWDAATGSLLNAFPGPEAISTIALSPDGRLLITGSRHGILQMWSLSDLRESFFEIQGIGSQEGKWFQNGCRSLALARSRRLLFTAGKGAESTAVQAWNLEGGQLTPAFELNGHTFRPVVFALSQDERFLASSSGEENGNIILWDLETRDSKILSSGLGPCTMAFSPDGKTLASRPRMLGDDGDFLNLNTAWPVDFWDTALENQKEPVARTIPFIGNSVGMSFTPDGKRFIVNSIVSGGPIHLLEIDPLTRETKLISEFGSHNDKFTGLEVSRDGRFFSVCSVNGNEAKLWDLTTLKPLGRIPGTSQWNYCTAISPDGSLVAYGGGGSFKTKVYRTSASGGLVWEFADAGKGLAAHVSDLEFDADGRTLIMGLNNGRVIVSKLPIEETMAEPWRYLEVIDLKDAAGELQWRVRNERLFPPVASREFARVEDRYLPFLKNASSPLEQKKALFSYYLKEGNFPAAHAVVSALDSSESEPMWEALTSSVARVLIRKRALGESRGTTGTLRHLAKQVFEQHPPELGVRLGLLIEDADWERLISILKEDFPSLPLEERATHWELLLQSLDAHVEALAPRLDSLDEKDSAIPPRSLLIASALCRAEKAFTAAWDTNLWAAAAIFEDPSPAAVFLDEFEKQSQQTVLPDGANWDYYTNLGAPGDGWNQLDYIGDSRWKTGATPMGYGGLTAGGITYGTRFNQLRSRDTGQLAFYFRKEFELPADWTAESSLLSASVLRDDGIVLYLDGREVLRLNMPEGEVSAETRAINAISAADKETWVDVSLPGVTLEPGRHLLAAEIHQAAPTSSDILFDLALTYPPTDGWRSSESLSAGLTLLTNIDPNQELFPWASNFKEWKSEDMPDIAAHRALAIHVLEHIRETDTAMMLVNRRLSDLKGSESLDEVSEQKYWLAWKMALLRTLGRPQAEIDGFYQEIASTPPRPRSLDPKQLDLSKFYNASLYAHRDSPPAIEGFGLRELPLSFRPLHGVTFDLRGVVQLNSGDIPPRSNVPNETPKTFNEISRRNYPDQVEGISVHQSTETIHFLMSCQYGRESAGAQVAHFLKSLIFSFTMKTAVR
ncbi:MAG: hypothetical protein KDN22_02905 [Verrucomicrobiae bacterium]|nr:hypothetical protein [Verrucomicrobiae bacterium]